MKKIKLVRYNNAEELERLTNEFIKDKKVLDIKIQTLLCNKSFNHQGVPLEADIIDTLLIIYEE